ncbi:MAG: LamG-like jellyroll fold domain-containing protein [Verrucomicrobiota bacterium]
MNDARLALLCSRYLDGQLTEAERAELEDLLRRSSAAREQFWRETRLHAQLHEVENEGAETLPTQPRRLTLPRWAQSPVNWLAMAACLGLALILALQFHPRQNIGTDNPANTPLESTSAAVAVLTHGVDLEWRKPEEARKVGTALEPGWLRLKAGLALVEFFNGARVLLEGPVEFQLVSATKGFCASGRLSAEVPAHAQGFTIMTPQVRVVDRGTAFGVSVGAQAAEVHVFKGKVELLEKVTPQRDLREGEAVTVAVDGTLRSIPTHSTVFASVAEFERRLTVVQRQQLAQWRAAALRLNSDPDLLLRFDFEIPANIRTLPNVTAKHSSTGDGTIVACERGEGRWPGKSALEFRSMGDRVRVNIPGEFRSITLTAWARVDGIERAFNSLFMCEGYGKGGFHWQISRKGDVKLGVKLDNQKDKATDYCSPVIFTPERLGRWVHLAVVYDAEAKQVTHFVDGVAVSREATRFVVPLRIGNADVGNWSLGTHSTIYPVRHFSGRMDELALYGRALREAEIQQLYAIGVPMSLETHAAVNAQSGIPEQQ